MSDLSLPETPKSPPPGVQVRVLDERATLARLMAGAPPDHDDVVDPVLLRETLAAQPVCEHQSGDVPDPVLFPLVVTEASTLSGMFSIPLDQAWALLPATERLVPVRVTPRRAAILFFAWEVRRGSLGRYHEMGVSLPVALDAAKPPAPGPPPLWRHPSIGLYAVELPVDSERVAQVGGAMLGLPHVVGRAELRVGPRGGSARFALEGADMARIDVQLGRWARVRRLDLSYQSYSLLGGRIVRTRHTCVGDGYRGRRGEVALTFGDHRRAQRLARLELSRRPLELRVVPRVNWIAGPPEDAGPA